MNERIFVVNSEGETTEDYILPVLNRYKKLIEEERNPSNLRSRIEKITLKPIEEPSLTVSNFLSNLSDDDLNALSTELPEDLYVQTELKERVTPFLKVLKNYKQLIQSEWRSSMTNRSPDFRKQMITTFLNDLNNEDLNKLRDELPEDLYVQKELENRNIN